MGVQNMSKYKRIRAASLFVGVLLFMASIQTSFAAFNITNWKLDTPIENKTTENTTGNNITWGSTNGSNDNTIPNTTPGNTTWSFTNNSVPSSYLMNITPFSGSKNFSIKPIKQLLKIQ
jgi:hypothetical protein